MKEKKRITKQRGERNRKRQLWPLNENKHDTCKNFVDEKDSTKKNRNHYMHAFIKRLNRLR